MLEVKDLKSRYGRIEVLHGISVEVREGEIVCLIGSNGAGKTTFLRALSGVQPVSGGAIRWQGKDISRVAAHMRSRLGIAQVPEGRQVFSPLSVEDNLKLGAWARRDNEIAADMENIYRMFPVLVEKRNIPAGSLSGGQQQMLAVGRALMTKPRLLLLDEPSMGLAPLLVDQILSSVADLPKLGITVLLVEQNATAALAISNRAYVLETGKIILSGEAASLANDERVTEAYLGL
ncbi:MAG: ABC transporter ATP-binding protein [Xanthobacteraceae bacterium]|nr:ABC transporter ATP-binding protein [Xanthobacteraceae bacterium]MCW5678143.1 ABC transporter ATP-binding protein [Xanthobacteraceae bacterium]